MPAVPRAVALPAYRVLAGLGGMAGRGVRAWRLAMRDPRAGDLAERLALHGALDALPREGAWLHAASVGEVRALAPLARAIRALEASRPLFVTTSSATGRERARSEIGLPCTLAPWDAARPLARFLDAVRPRLHVAVETEVWPARLAALARRGVPAALVSARISEARFASYRRFDALYGPALAGLAFVAPASEADRARLAALGVRESAFGPTGNLKWDAAPDPPAAARVEQTRAALGLDRDVRWIVLGSAHPGESAPIAQALGASLAPASGTGLVVAPRHPHRFDDVARELAAAGHPAHRASAGPAGPASRVVVVDRLGLLPSLYPLAAVALVGGTFVPVGGHSPLEAAAAHCPLVAGPHTDAQHDLVAPLEQAGGLVRVATPAEAARATLAWIADDAARTAAGRAARRLVEASRGVADALASRLAGLRP